MKKLFVILCIMALGLPIFAQNQFLEVSRSANLYRDSVSSSPKLEKLGGGTELIPLNDGRQTKNGWYLVMAPSGKTGYVYRTRVRGKKGDAATGSLALGSSNERLRRDLWPSSDESDIIVTHEGYISCMSTEFNVPKWVFSHINADMLEITASGTKRPSKYFRDSNYNTLKQTAYSGSGYDHGHLAPAGDFKSDSSMYAESFYMTNMAPQHGCMNQKGWCLLESNVRKWSRDRPGSDFYLISGSILTEIIDTLCLPRNIEVHVPSQFYKVILEVSNNTLVGGTAYILDNGDVNGFDVSKMDVTIDEVEAITGFNFFPNLTPFQESQIEAKKANYGIENISECIKRNKPCGNIYKSRTTPEGRTKLNCE